MYQILYIYIDIITVRSFNISQYVSYICIFDEILNLRFGSNVVYRYKKLYSLWLRFHFFALNSKHSEIKSDIFSVYSNCINVIFEKKISSTYNMFQYIHFIAPSLMKLNWMFQVKFHQHLNMLLDFFLLHVPTKC